MAGSFSHNDRVHYPWLHPEPQDCVTSNTSPVSVLDCPSYTHADTLGGQQAAQGWSPEKAAYGTGSVTYNSAIALPVQPSVVPSLADVHASAAHHSRTTDGSQHVWRPNIGHTDCQTSSQDDRSSSSGASSCRRISRRHERSQSRESITVRGRSQTGSKIKVKKSSSRSRSCSRRKRSTQNGGNQSWSVTRKLDGQLTLQSQYIALQYSWGVDSAAQGQIDLIAWICATDTVGREWSESAWQEELQTAWNGDLLVFAMPQAGNDSSNAHRSHAELQFVRLAGLLRASGEALAGTIALHAADGEDDRLLEARLWLTASRGTIDTVFDMLSEEAQHSLEAAVPAMFQPYKHAELTCLFGIITMAHLAGNNDAKVSAKPKCYEQSQQRGSNQCQVARPSRLMSTAHYNNLKTDCDKSSDTAVSDPSDKNC
ncbi:MAG: hypothetical protein FRX49_08562 [Trebouxia sp. A1-2]|nr:MAG: hypothetical protein FRX49_08562 [Trebouxia sp. A1-2]